MGEGKLIHLRPSNAPPLFADEHEIHTELEPVEVVEGELVDDPTAPPIGWMAERRGARRPAVIPAHLRDPAQIAANTRFITAYYAREGGFYAARTPIYLGRLWACAPRGTARLTVRWARWVTYAEAAERRADSSDAWIREEEKLRAWRAGRRRASAITAAPAAGLLVLAYLLLPAWASAAAAAGIWTLLGLAGRRAGRPIIGRYVMVQTQRRLESPEVENALAAIGIKGTVDWVNHIAVDGPGWLAELDLPGAHEADSVLEKRSKLAAAMRRPLACVWPEGDRDAHPGRLRLWIAREDPNKAARRIWPLMKSGQADLFDAIPYGFDPRGRPVSLRLMGSNVLIGGVMGSGKTSAVLVIALATALDPTAELWIYEMKGSGDLEALKPVCHRYVSGDEDEDCESALAALRTLEAEMRRRKAIIKELPMSDVPDGRKVYPHLAARRHLRLHPLVAIFDECHTLFEHEEYGGLAADVAGRLIRKARAYGIIVVFTTQKPDASSVPRMVSDNAIDRILLAVTGHIPNDIIAGTGAYKRGVRGTMFDPERDAGTGWMVRGLSARIVRAAFIKQAEAEEIARRAHAMRVAAGTLSGQAIGAAIEDADQSNLIDHLREIWPASETAMHSVRLVEALAIYRPDLYREWTATDRTGQSTMLATALKPYGVQTRQVQRRGDGGSAKGVVWDDLKQALEADLEPI